MSVFLIIVAGTHAVAPLAESFHAYASKFGVDEKDDASFGHYVRDVFAAQELRVGPNMTCATCYTIHGGQPGDCSAIFGCNNALCSFCTNPPTCADCYKINQGAQGSCCSVMGCNNQLCSFCTNPDSTAGSCPPTPPTPPPDCPGGSLKACIKLCPSDPCAGYQACTNNCVAKC